MPFGSLAFMPYFMIWHLVLAMEVNKILTTKMWYILYSFMTALPIYSHTQNSFITTNIFWMSISTKQCAKSVRRERERRRERIRKTEIHFPYHAYNRESGDINQLVQKVNNYNPLFVLQRKSIGNNSTPNRKC